MVKRWPPVSHYGFTLLEVVLAIGLSTVVLLILTTAIHQFLFRTDASHARVETIQLARALLNRMADDLRAARVAPASTDQTATGRASTGRASTGSEETSTGSHDGSGIVGTSTEIWIDRAGAWRWEPVQDVPLADARGSPAGEIRYAQTAHPPETIRYFLREGDEVSSAELARAGIREIVDDSIAGLCLERWTTAKLSAATRTRTGSTNSSSTTESLTARGVELLAPEVIELEFAYADGEGELVDQWNSAEMGDLPRAVEIRLTLRKELPPGTRDSRAAGERVGRPDGTRQYAPGDRVKYRLVVELPEVEPPRTLEVAPRGGSRDSSDSVSSDSVSSDSTNPTDSEESGGDASR